MTTKNLIFIFRAPPYSTAKVQEGLDALLAAAVFDQSIKVIFMGDGVFQLRKNQQPDSGKNVQKMLQSLVMDDINQIFVQISALQERNLSEQDINIDCVSVSDAEIRQIMSGADHILSF